MSIWLVRLGDVRPDSAAYLRAKVAAHVQSRPDSGNGALTYRKWAQVEYNMGIEEYVAHLSQTYAWGGALEISILCEMYNVVIEVFQQVEEGYERILSLGGNNKDAVDKKKFCRFHWTEITMKSWV